jgi:hypothetical protein
MLEILKDAEHALTHYLEPDHEWNSLLVNYHKPHVWRLWTQMTSEYRILLHKIHLCKEGEALLHPHPWPAAMKIFVPAGTEGYETGVGWDHPEAADAPAMPAKFMLQTQSTYEMTDYHAWHYVRPVGGPIYSLMVIGAPYDVVKQKRFGQLREHKQLTEGQRDELLTFFRAIYR